MTKEVRVMAFYYTGYSCCGWIPAHGNERSGWHYFSTVDEYVQAYQEALCPC